MRWTQLWVLAALVASTARADDAAAWLRQRAQAHSAHVASQRPSLEPGAQLWRERPADDVALTAFVPPTSLAPLVRAVSPGVVNVSTVMDAPSQRMRGGQARRSLGSGFVISPDGFVVTNNHVVEAAQSVLVQLADGREYLAEIVGRDASTDVALLRLQGSPGDLPFAFLGDSDALEVGDWVVAIGNPFGLDHSVAHGMISAKERVLGIGVFDDFIQTDALINPGNSGGPLFNMRGEVVGVNTAIISQGQGIGFAVPINMVKELIPNLRENGRLARGWLGVNIVEGVGAKGKGAVVSDVFRGSPAAQAGLRAGDRVLAVNGRAVENFQQLLRKVSFLAPGSRAVLKVQREGKDQDVTVVLSERPAPQTLQILSAAARTDAVGLIVRDVTAELGKTLSLRPESGALVAGVMPGSGAERAGLRAGDLITEVNRKEIRGAQDFRAAVAKASANTLLVRYQRGDAVRYVAVDVE